MKGEESKQEPYRTVDVTATKEESFEDFILPKSMLQALASKGFKYPSPIQKQLIPLILGGKSVVARAKNGTGKTAAYVIPMLNCLNPLDLHVQAIVLLPTRELATQTEALVNEFGENLHLSSMCVTGGTAVKQDVMRLVGGRQVIVGTPGRVVDLFTKGVLSLERLKILVLDEVDQLLTQDFTAVIEQFVGYVAATVQIVAISATFPGEMERFIQQHLQDAVAVNTMSELTLLGVSQFYVLLAEEDKIRKLVELLCRLAINQLIVFCNSNKRVEYV